MGVQIVTHFPRIDISNESKGGLCIQNPNLRPLLRSLERFATARIRIHPRPSAHSVGFSAPVSARSKTPFHAVPGPELMTPDTLIEDLSDWSSRLAIDSQARLVCNVALTGPDSKNGYHYSEAALREATPLYDQKPVFLDHAPDRLKPRDRSTRDLVGNIVNPRFEDGRIRGDIRVLDTESGRTFLALANTNLPGVGMSHVVLAQRSTDGTVVESIRDVVCVDAVINPATTQTFRESTLTISSPLVGDGLAVRAPDSTQDSNTESLPPNSQLSVLNAQLDQLREQVAALQARAQAAELQLDIQKLLSEAQLPPSALSPLFKQQLEQASSPEVRRELLRDRQALCEQRRQSSPLSWDRPTAKPPVPATDFIAAIKNRSH